MADICLILDNCNVGATLRCLVYDRSFNSLGFIHIDIEVSNILAKPFMQDCGLFSVSNNLLT